MVFMIIQNVCLDKATKQSNGLKSLLMKGWWGGSVNHIHGSCKRRREVTGFQGVRIKQGQIGYSQLHNHILLHSSPAESLIMTYTINAKALKNTTVLFHGERLGEKLEFDTQSQFANNVVEPPEGSHFYILRQFISNGTCQSEIPPKLFHYQT